MGVVELQATLVDDIKRRALRALHRTPRGEALVLRTYLWAEELAEGEVLDETAAGAPPWLARQLERHAADEKRHAVLLRQRLDQLGQADAGLPGADALCRSKLDKLRALAAAYAPRFRSPVVPLLAVACGMERLGVRVMSRHLAVLAEDEAPGRPHPTATLLRRIVAEERGHVAGCERALARLVEPDEEAPLAELRRRIAAIDRAWGVTGALTFLALGGWFRLRGVVDAGLRRTRVRPAMSELAA